MTPFSIHNILGEKDVTSANLKMQSRTNILILITLFLVTTITAQPLLSSKKEVADYMVYQDFKNSDLFYYAPGKLDLAKNPNGEPKFNLVSMRYTGSFATGNQGENRRLSLVQLCIQMTPFHHRVLNKIKLELGKKDARLRPLPIRNLEATLIAPVGGRFQRLGSSENLEAPTTREKRSRNSFWTERTFTLRLEDTEAQLLWNQIQKGQLSLSLAYAFYADVIIEKHGDYQIGGDSIFIQKAVEKLQKIAPTDTALLTKQIMTGAFPIRIDAEKYPHLLKQMDIDGELPAAYPVLAIKCYDFTDNLRPDLFLKTVDVQATGINGQLVSMRPGKFKYNAPDQNSIQVHFPFAIRMDKPLRYRTTEYTKDGNKTQSDWHTQESWSKLIDITTGQRQNPTKKRNLEIETDFNIWQEKGIQELRVQLSYVFRESPLSEQFVFKATNNLPLNYVTLIQDQDTDLSYQAVWILHNGEIIKTKRKILSNENYLFFNPKTIKQLNN